MSDCNVYPEGGYVGLSSIPWVQTSTTVFPNMIITHDDRVHLYAIELQNNNWWFYYDGQWVGYIPHSAWTCVFPHPNDVQFGGEVETPELTTCTDMGNGLLGTQANSATIAYTYWVNEYWARPAELEYAIITDPGQYNAGQWVPSKNAYSFHYGGPGWC
jgi:hypothetical protein